MKKVLITGANKGTGFEVANKDSVLKARLELEAGINFFRRASNNHHLINLTCE